MPFIAGSAASPSIRFNPDNHSGLYLRSVSDIAMSVNSSAVMSWNAFSVSSNLPIWLTSGTLAKPSLAFQADQTTGFYRSSSGVTTYASGGEVGPSLSVDGLTLPAGGFANRPGSPPEGLIRANTETGGIDLFINSEWSNISPPVGFGSLAEANAYTTSVAPGVIFLSGYYAPGDLGVGATYTRVGGEPPHSGKFSVQENGSTVWYEILCTDHVNVGWFGMKGDGTPENMNKFEDALGYMFHKGGGILYFPTGEYLVGQGTAANVAMHVDVSNVFLVGEGPQASIIRLNDGEESHVINFYNVNNVGLYGLGIDGNRTEQTLQVHGIRLQNVTNAYISNFLIENTLHYAIGCQEGKIASVRIAHGFIRNIGGDCIDFKNKLSTNTRNYVDHITIDTWGLNGAASGQAGIDCRGPVSITNVNIMNPPNDGVGIRFREGEAGVDVNGAGGHTSSLNQFDVQLGATTSSFGVVVNARDVMVSNGYIKGGQRGMQVNEARTKVTNVTSDSPTNECFFAGTAGSLEGDWSTFTNCTGIGALRGFRTAVDNVQFIGCWSHSSTNGFQIDAAADGTSILGGGAATPVSAGVADSGTNSRIRNVDGYKTQATVETGSLTLDASGSKTFSIPHGLPFTPDLKDVQLQLIRETAVTDPVIVNLWVEATDSTIVQGRARVTTASATVGATFRVAIRVEGKNGP